ncbi:hypothetical protein BaRGS_00002542 [Batillaria attramentaria]|uniref:Uncharacterized protein n=1 Tax=Batillaria attramentaria TaxID=370345 RepID=A0ABD0M4L2_9CAEN
MARQAVGGGGHQKGRGKRATRRCCAAGEGEGGGKLLQRVTVLIESFRANTAAFEATPRLRSPPSHLAFRATVRTRASNLVF